MVHHHTLESKQQSKQWKRQGSPPPKKAKALLSAKKVMASVFGIVKVSLWWIISQKVKQSTQHTIALFYVVCVKTLKVNGTVCCPKKCCFIKTTRVSTRRPKV